jgi:putative oxidoreductase
MKLEMLKKQHDKLYVVFRVLVGLMFFLHGAGKLFGWFGGNKIASLASLMGVAGVVEFAGGLAIALGFFSRLGALGGAVVMIVAYFKVHFPGGWNPLANKGELALLYFAAMLVIMAHGNKKYSLEQSLLKKETF